MKLIYVLLISFISEPIMAQFPNFPEEVKKELQIKKINVNGFSMSYGVSYPKGYLKDKIYPVLLCLVGGSFAERLTYYYHHVYVPKESFQEYIKIYPISPSHKSLLNFSSRDWKELVSTVQQSEKSTTKDKWVISGASNGGLATYNLISASPKTFKGFITIPGSMQNQKLLPEWKNYKVLIVYMNLDYGWISGSKMAYDRLKNHVKSIELYEIKGYGHILDDKYNIEPLYRRFLAL